MALSLQTLHSDSGQLGDQGEVGAMTEPRTQSTVSSPFTPRVLLASQLLEAAAEDQGHDPSLNLPSNWEGQMSP